MQEIGREEVSLAILGGQHEKMRGLYNPKIDDALHDAPDAGLSDWHLAWVGYTACRS